MFSRLALGLGLGGVSSLLLLTPRLTLADAVPSPEGGGFRERWTGFDFPLFNPTQEVLMLRWIICHGPENLNISVDSIIRWTARWKTAWEHSVFVHVANADSGLLVFQRLDHADR